MSARTSPWKRLISVSKSSASLEQDAIPYLGRLKLSEIEARDLDGLAASIAKRGVAPSTVRIALAPVKALLATVHNRGEIRWNPAAGYRSAYTHEAIDANGADREDVVALNEEQLAAVLEELPEG
jgi:integrase